MVATWADGLYTGFGSSGVPSGGCSPARQTSMSDSPPQAIPGLLSASPARDPASAIRFRGFSRLSMLNRLRARRPDLRRSAIRSSSFWVCLFQSVYFSFVPFPFYLLFFSFFFFFFFSFFFF